MISPAMLKTIGLIIITLLLVACLGLAWAGRELPAALLELYQVNRTAREFYASYEHASRDIAFDPGLEPRLDVYSPGSGSGYPVLLFVHGGAWRSYSKEMFATVAMRLLPEGIVVVIPDYTLFPDAESEQMAQEVASAISWTLDEIEQYGGDPSRVVVAGHSAGAHLLGLAAMDPRYLSAYGHTGDELCGLAGLSGVYDVQAEYDFWRARGPGPRLITRVMGGEQNFRQASPLSYVRAGLPPTLLIHGEKDASVPVGMAVDFSQALAAAGSPVELRIYPGAEHSDYLFAALTGVGSPLVADLAAFVHACTP